MIAEKLKKGDTIAVFSPSLPATYLYEKRYEKAKKFIEEKGFKLLEGNLTCKEGTYKSGSILQRAEELNSLIRNKEVRCIISSIGGCNSNSLLDYIDYESLKKDPKIIIGYSDVTALLLGIYAKTGLVTYYGPALVASFGEFSPLVDDTYFYFEKLLCGKPSFPMYIQTPKYYTDQFIDWNEQKTKKDVYPNYLTTVIGGTAKGRLIGGNLTTMEHIFSTPYMPKIKEGDILLLEDTMANPMSLERSFAHLKLAKVFDKVGGIILGKFELYNDLGSSLKPYEILLEVLDNKYNFPIISDFDCCHTHPMITMPIASTIELNATFQSVRIICEN